MASSSAIFASKPEPPPNFELENFGPLITSTIDLCDSAKAGLASYASYASSLVGNFRMLSDQIEGIRKLLVSISTNEKNFYTKPVRYLLPFVFDVIKSAKSLSSPPAFPCFQKSELNQKFSKLELEISCVYADLQWVEHLFNNGNRLLRMVGPFGQISYMLSPLNYIDPPTALAWSAITCLFLNPKRLKSFAIKDLAVLSCGTKKTVEEGALHYLFDIFIEPEGEHYLRVCAASTLVSLCGREESARTQLSNPERVKSFVKLLKDFNLIQQSLLFPAVELVSTLSESWDPPSKEEFGIEGGTLNIIRILKTGVEQLLEAMEEGFDYSSVELRLDAPTTRVKFSCLETLMRLTKHSRKNCAVVGSSSGLILVIRFGQQDKQQLKDMCLKIVTNLIEEGEADAAFKRELFGSGGVLHELKKYLVEFLHQEDGELKQQAIKAIGHLSSMFSLSSTQSSASTVLTKKLIQDLLSNVTSKNWDVRRETTTTLFKFTSSKENDLSPQMCRLVIDYGGVSKLQELLSIRDPTTLKLGTMILCSLAYAEGDKKGLLEVLMNVAFTYSNDLSDEVFEEFEDACGALKVDV